MLRDVRRGTRTSALILGLLLLTAVVYWPVHRFDFVEYDDTEYLLTNPHARAGFTVDNLRYAFTTAPLGNWAPLTWISYFADGQFLGLRPGPMHIENVVFHAGAGILLWLMLSQATGETYRSCAVAALFLCHPMHVESVAWISERKDVLSTLLLLGAMLAYVCYCKATAVAGRLFAYAVMLALFVLSLSAKSMGITLPAVLLLTDFWPLGRLKLGNIRNRSLWKCVAEKVPLIAIAAVMAVISLLAQQSNGAAASSSALSFTDRLTNALVCYVIYIAKLAVPTNLAVFYQHPGSRPISVGLAAAGLLAMVTYFAWRRRARSPFLIVGWLWFLGTLLPVIGLVQIGAQAMADRYSYFPSIGLFIAVVWGLAPMYTRESTTQFHASVTAPTKIRAKTQRSRRPGEEKSNAFFAFSSSRLLFSLRLCAKLLGRKRRGGTAKACTRGRRRSECPGIAISP